MQASRVISYMQTLLGDPSGDYHTNAKMLLHLNAALEDICDRSRSLKVSSYHQVEEEQAFYGLPPTFLEVDIVGILWQGKFYELQYADLGVHLPSTFTAGPQPNQPPWRYTIWGQGAREKYIGNVIASPTPGADTSGEVFFFSDIPMPDARPGDRLVNVTDDSEGQITHLDEGFSEVTFADLVGGDNNRMQIGDIFRVISPEESVKNIIISPPPQFTDPVGTESLFIYYTRSHAEMTQYLIDNDNDTLEIDPEFASALRNRIGYYASLDEHGADHPTTEAFDIRYQTDYARATVPVNRRIREFITSWRDGVRRNRSIRGFETISRNANWNSRPY